ncbi:MAG: serine/threonine-protein kinase [Myxococcota bacterium]
MALLRAKVAPGRGDDAQALKDARRAGRLAAGWGSDLVQASARMILGEVARSMRLLDEAERAYATAERLYGDTLSARIARLNRAMVAAEGGEAAKADALARPMVGTFPGNPLAESAAQLCIVPATVARGELGAVETLIGEVCGRLWAAGAVHRDVASLSTVAGEALAAAGQPELAIRLTALAHEQWQRLGNAEQLARVADRLRTLREQGAAVPLRGFLLDAVIGEGASGTVWRGRHAGSGELVAIKILRGGPAVTSSVRSMFARELRAVAGLDHPNVVWLLDHGWVDDAAAVVEPLLELDAPFLALEYGTLATLDPRCGRMTWPELLPLLLGVLDGLAHAHARGLLHLDLKPTNVLLAGPPDAPIPKLADFGLARAPAPGRQLRATGTPAYMAPEQFGNDAGALGPWTDLYALGCLITAALHGRAAVRAVRRGPAARRPPEQAPAAARAEDARAERAVRHPRQADGQGAVGALRQRGGAGAGAGGARAGRRRLDGASPRCRCRRAGRAPPSSRPWSRPSSPPSCRCSRRSRRPSRRAGTCATPRRGLGPRRRGSGSSAAPAAHRGGELERGELWARCARW